jgi:FKBP-type peptidyl-prolyl cis-trans isomerase (trigger factor)
MSLVQEIVYENSISCYSNIHIPKDEFLRFSDKIQNQVLKNVKVDGFRPGKAPMNKLMSQVDPTQLTQTIIEETVKKHLPKSVEELSKKIREENRTALEFEATLNGDSLGALDDGSFIFRIKVRILPVMDLSKLKKITQPLISDNDINIDRPSIEEFINSEKAKLLESLNEERVKKGEEKTEDLQVAIDSIADAKGIFQSAERFEDSLKNIYDYETQYLRSNIRQRKFIESVLNDVKDFDIPESLIEPDIERISANMLEDAKENNVTISELYEKSGLPNYDETEVKDEDSLKNVLHKYVYNEFKLMFTLREIYENETPKENRITDSKIEEIVTDMKANPDSYRVPKDLPTETYHNLAFDRLMRATAIETINYWAENNSTSKTKETVIKKEKIKDA